MPQLFDPRLDLFLYDLGESLGQTFDDRETKLDNFKSKLPTKVVSQMGPRPDQEGEYVELLGEKKFHSFSHGEDYEGYYYPVKLRDSYGLLLDCSPCQQHQASENWQWLTDLKRVIEQKLQGPGETLGRTWVFCAAMPTVSVTEYEAIAQACYRALMPNISAADWQVYKTGESEFTGGKLFECWCPGQYHLVIMLFATREDLDKKVPALILDEMRLFEYRHKITWAYDQSRTLKKLLKTEAQEIQACRERFQKDEDHSILLKDTNKVLSTYLSLLTGLESQGYTIETNLHNYRKRLIKVQEKLAGLNFPTAFEEEVVEKYLPQIRQDHAILSPQLKLIENEIASIQADESHRIVNELHHHVGHIAAVQSKVEWLEVFFASYYAAALAHYIAGGFRFTESYSAWSVVGWAVLAGLLTLLGLQPWRSSHGETSKRPPWWMWLGIAMIMAMGWFVIGYECFRDGGGGLSH